MTRQSMVQKGKKKRKKKEDKLTYLGLSQDQFEAMATPISSAGLLYDEVLDVLVESDDPETDLNLALEVIWGRTDPDDLEEEDKARVLAIVECFAQGLQTLMDLGGLCLLASHAMVGEDDGRRTFPAEVLTTCMADVAYSNLPSGRKAQREMEEYMTQLRNKHSDSADDEEDEDEEDCADTGEWEDDEKDDADGE